MAKSTLSIESLVIVESPAKAKTIEKFLGTGYQVESSIGHIRDLPTKEMGIDIANDFKPEYVINSDKKKTVSSLKSLAKQSKNILLATDEDREGEAIAWHLYEALELKNKPVQRIVFHEITKSAIQKAISNPRELDIDLVNAQQARRVLDRLVGYELSPVLWKKVRRGLSAGRVQSVAVRIISDREKEIENFDPEISYKTTGEFILSNGGTLKADLKRKFQSYNEALEFVKSINNADFKIEDIQTRPTKKSPAPPFTTSTLQQEAARKLGFSVKQTMTLAQRLYETGRITYMRTDSVNLSEDAISAIQNHINSTFGEQYSNIRRYKTKSSGAQEAHEAIRPTEMSLTSIPESDYQLQRLYDLIRKRAIASQMADAQLEKTTISISNNKNKEIFNAVGEVIKFDGFLKMYIEDTDDDVADDDEEVDEGKILPKVSVGEMLPLKSCQSREVFTRPPARYTEASLVRKLEEMGIGRPSTYSPTISTIIEREYVIKQDKEGIPREFKTILLQNKEIQETKKTEVIGTEKSKLFPTDTGTVVTDFLVKYFPNIVDFTFTARVEEEFDEIAQGKKKWNEMIGSFYTDFSKTILDSDKVTRQEVSQARLIGSDPKSGKPIFARIGRFGPMLQIGEVEDEEKPRFAPMPKGQTINSVTMEDALKMFELPRIIGVTRDGIEVSANIGRFGPFIKYDKLFVSIKQEELYSLTLEEALEKVETKKESDAAKFINEFDNGKIQVLNGRWGPYIKVGKDNFKIPKGTEAATLTEAECKKIIESSKNSPKKSPPKRGRK